MSKCHLSYREQCNAYKAERRSPAPERPKPARTYTPPPGNKPWVVKTLCGFVRVVRTLTLGRFVSHEQARQYKGKLDRSYVQMPGQPRHQMYGEVWIEGPEGYDSRRRT